MLVLRKYISSKFASEGMLKLPREIPGELIDLYLLKELKRFGEDASVIYAFEQTSLWVTKQYECTFTKAQLAKWDRAIERYSSQDV